MSSIDWSIILLLFLIIYVFVERSRYQQRISKPLLIIDVINALLDDGFNEHMVMFVKDLISRLQEKCHDDNQTHISRCVIERILSWDYSQVMSEDDYRDVYLQNKMIFDELFNNLYKETGMSLYELTEHIEHWSDEARISEVVITDCIARVIDTHISE